MPEIQAQIDSLRLAFSADTSRPFELKPTFPYGSPSEPYHPSPPPFDSSHYTPPLSQVTGVQSRVGYTAYPISPPISTGTEDAKSDSSQLQPLGLLTPHPVSNASSMEAPLVDENSWDPTRIIKYGSNCQTLVHLGYLLTLHLVNGTWPSLSTRPPSVQTHRR